MLERIGPTVLLMAAGLAIAIVRRHRGRDPQRGAGATPRLDIGLSVVAFFGISSPAFLTALLGLYLFSVLLRWAPSGGMLTPGAPSRSATCWRISSCRPASCRSAMRL